MGAGSRRLRVADDAELVEQPADARRGGSCLLEADARLWVEVEAQLVGDVGAVAEIRPDVEAEAPEVHRPRHVRHVEDERA